MFINDIRGASQHIIMRGRSQITNKYATETTLYDFQGTYIIAEVWSPYPPSPSKQKKLAGKIKRAMEPHLAKAFELIRLRCEGGAQ